MSKWNRFIKGSILFAAKLINITIIKIPTASWLTSSPTVWNQTTPLNRGSEMNYDPSASSGSHLLEIVHVLPRGFTDLLRSKTSGSILYQWSQIFSPYHLLESSPLSVVHGWRSPPKIFWKWYNFLSFLPPNFNIYSCWNKMTLYLLPIITN